MLLFSFAKFADKLSVENVSVRPSSHIIAVGSIDSPLHHPKDRRSTVNLRFPTLNASLNLSIGREFYGL